MNTKLKKDVTTQSKKQNANKTYVANAYSTRVDKHARKSAPAGLQARSKPGQWRQQAFCKNETSDQNFLNKKNRKF